MNCRNIAAASCSSLVTPLGMPRPAPPVGHTPVFSLEPPGRNPTPTLNLADFRMPIREPVEDRVAEASPAAKSSADSLEETPAQASLYTESWAACRAATDSAESQVMSQPLDQLPPSPHRLFCRVQ